MQKIKAIGVAVSQTGTLYITDELGQLWMCTNASKRWSKVELPEQPDGEWNHNGSLGVLPEQER